MTQNTNSTLFHVVSPWSLKRLVTHSILEQAIEEAKYHTTSDVAPYDIEETLDDKVVATYEDRSHLPSSNGKYKFVRVTE